MNYSIFQTSGLYKSGQRRAVAIPVAETNSHSSAADRFLLTLLALGLMLLAFFVVLTSATTFDQRRVGDVMQSVHTSFERPQEISAVPAIDAGREAAVGALRTAVAEIFSAVAIGDPAVLADDQANTNPDRVEVDVPAVALFADAKLAAPSPFLDKMIALADMPPAGYRMELVVRAAATGDAALDLERAATLADALVRRGLAPTTLSAGVHNDEVAPHAGGPSVRFTFLLLETDQALAAARLMAGARPRVRP